MGFQTVTGLAKRGYFIPYRQAGEAVPPTIYPSIAMLFDQSQPSFELVLNRMAELGPALAELNGPPPRPRWSQDWFARLDGAAAYTMVRSVRPKRIIEIGSGHSTRFMHAAIVDGDLDTQLTTIDPEPRADIAALPIEHVCKMLQQADMSVFDSLASGDILFVDSSHILMPGSDVDLIFSEILPRLPVGSIVHIHDVFLPDAYPDHWDWRCYNEQQGVAALLAGGGFVPMFSSHYVATRMADAVARTPVGKLPLNDGVPETSLWLSKRSAGRSTETAETLELFTHT